MAQLDDFVDGVSIHLGNTDASNVPRIAVVFAARQALKKFCDESFAYIVNAFDPLIDINRPLTDSDLALTRLDKRCELSLPANTHIIKVWRLTDNHCEHDGWLASARYGYPNIINLNDKQRRTDNVVCHCQSVRPQTSVRTIFLIITMMVCYLARLLTCR